MEVSVIGPFTTTTQQKRNSKLIFDDDDDDASGWCGRWCRFFVLLGLERRTVERQIILSSTYVELIRRTMDKPFLICATCAR
jgi:hypothetical protein